MTSRTDRSVGTSPVVPCPECGASVRTGAERCWLCHRALTSKGESLFAPPTKAGRMAPGSGAGQFSLATILLVITLVAVCLGVFRISPGFGVIVVVLATPALVRTIVAGAQEKQRGHRLSLAEKVATFAASVGVMLIAGAAGIAAFLAACFGTCGLAAAMQPVAPPEAFELLFSAGCFLSIGVAIAVTVLVIWALRPRRS